VIVATAGHIDHGKTLLVKALTGVDTDRLPEEKRRGLSIDLGFAYDRTEDGVALGFVDVPGHERFVHNMLAGVTGVDFVLLVVAADDGPMPQTVEHLAILDLLGLRRGAVVVNKTDRVPSIRIDDVVHQIRAMVDRTSLAGSPIFEVSALTGDGLGPLHRHLWQAARSLPQRMIDGGFRLAVDRSFTLAGSGLIVTGTAFAGQVRVGDRLMLSPAGIEVRVRGIHAHNRPQQAGQAGDRCALNLIGAELRRIGVRRGDWVLDPRLHAPTDRLDARLTVLANVERGLRHWTPVHVHLAAAHVEARVAVLEGRVIEPGASALVQLVLDRPVDALFGDRLIVRDAAAQNTVSGGLVIDPWPPRRGCRRPERLATLVALERPAPTEAFAALLREVPDGVDLAAFARARNLSFDALEGLGRTIPFRTISIGGRSLAVTIERWRSMQEAILKALADYHSISPDRPGAPLDVLRRVATPVVLVEAVLAALVAEGRVTRVGNAWCLPRHTPTTDPDEALWCRIRPLMAGRDLRSPTINEVATVLGLSPNALAGFFARMARKGRVVAIASNRYCEAGVVAKLGRIAEAVAASRAGAITAAAFRDHAGIGRNLAIDLLEYFDRAGFTRRVGDAHRVVRPAMAVFRQPEESLEPR
jgi:selenocysteine-specific elongation factor